MRIRGTLALLALTGLGLTGCSTADQPADSPAAQDEGHTQITISAAASLQRSFDEIAKDFQEEHPQIKVKHISYDGSSTLATQIVEGAPVDVFASADERNMDTVSDAGLAKDPVIFATNTLVIAVPAGNPAHVQSLADLSQVTTVLCAPQVPCGGASQKLLDGAGVQVEPASMEQNVSAVLQKVSAGEADAGLVYRTDVVGDDRVDSIVPDGAQEVVNSYPISVLSTSQSQKQAEAAQQFVDYVLGAEGQEVLVEHGFGNAGAGAEG